MSDYEYNFDPISVTDPNPVGPSNTAGKKKMPKVIWFGAAVAAIILITVIVMLSMTDNTYETPIAIMEKMYNSMENYDTEKMETEMLNGFAEAEFKEIFGIFEKSDDIQDMLEEAQDGYVNYNDSMEDEYGRNYKIKLTIDDKQKLERADLRDYKDDLRQMAEDIDEMLWYYEDYDELADELGITGSEAKQLTRAIESFGDKLRDAEVTGGYELDVLVSITGSELDEPEEEYITVYVYKVDGRWISEEAFAGSILGVLY